MGHYGDEESLMEQRARGKLMRERKRERKKEEEREEKIRRNLLPNLLSNLESEYKLILHFLLYAFSILKREHSNIKIR